MISDDIPVVSLDPYTKKAYEFKDPRAITNMHGYECPICEEVIGLCHDAGLLAQACLLWDTPDVDPDSTQPPIGFEIVGG